MRITSGLSSVAMLTAVVPSLAMPLLITGLTAGYTTDYGILMLSVTITTLVTLILFFTQQKRFVEGVLGSVK